jgi:hypothetical protein
MRVKKGIENALASDCECKGSAVDITKAKEVVMKGPPNL